MFNLLAFFCKFKKRKEFIDNIKVEEFFNRTIYTSKLKKITLMINDQNTCTTKTKIIKKKLCRFLCFN